MLQEIKRTLLSTLLITIAVIIAVISLITAIEIHCVNDSYYWMPLYPDAELVETSQQGYFRVRGIGETLQIYSSPTDAATIRTWYRDYRREITAGLQNANPNTAITGFGENDFVISPADNGTGSIIRYYTNCAQ